MIRRVVVTLTPLEAEMLDYLASDMMSDPDELRNRLHNKRRFDACCTALEKLNAARFARGAGK